jgi:hypothetical protein
LKLWRLTNSDTAVLVAKTFALPIGIAAQFVADLVDYRGHPLAFRETASRAGANARC